MRLLVFMISSYLFWYAVLTMKEKSNNYAFIDSQNLERSIERSGWILDMRRFRVYLRDKYHARKAYMFLGYIENNNELYQHLREHGYILIFRPILRYKNGVTKGNCDAELILQTMIEYKNYEKAIIVSGDGDFYCLVKYLIEQNKLEALIIPNQFEFSALLKISNFKKYLRFMNDLKDNLKHRLK